MARRVDLDRVAEMLEGLIYVTQNLARNQDDNAAHAPLIPGHVESNYFKRISRARPPTYDGTPYPKELQSWVWEMEKVFDVVRCLEAQKVVNRAYYLRDQADL